MLEYYFQKALVEDISPSEFMNVIRIILHKAPTHNGVDGEDHYASVNKRVQNAFKLSEVEVVEDTIEEETEINEIIDAYKSKQIQHITTCVEDLKPITRQLKKDKNQLDLIDEYSIDDSDDEFDIIL